MTWFSGLLTRGVGAALPPSMITPHFAWAEAGCRDGTPVPRELRENAVDVARELERLRSHLGVLIRCNSWYRTAAHNAKVKSKETSQHRLARAVDIVVAGMAPARVYDEIEVLIERGEMRDGGLGEYAGFVHYDLGPPGRRWRR